MTNRRIPAGSSGSKAASAASVIVLNLPPFASIFPISSANSLQTDKKEKEIIWPTTARLMFDIGSSLGKNREHWSL
jgi:hypothetical protein